MDLVNEIMTAGIDRHIAAALWTVCFAALVFYATLPTGEGSLRREKAALVVVIGSFIMAVVSTHVFLTNKKSESTSAADHAINDNAFANSETLDEVRCVTNATLIAKPACNAGEQPTIFTYFCKSDSDFYDNLKTGQAAVSAHDHDAEHWLVKGTIYVFSKDLLEINKEAQTVTPVSHMGSQETIGRMTEVPFPKGPPLIGFVTGCVAVKDLEGSLK